MAKFTLYDIGEVIDAKSEKDLVSEMRLRSIYFTTQTNAQFMHGYADRARILMGITLDYSSESAFVKSLISHKLAAKGADPSALRNFNQKK